MIRTPDQLPANRDNRVTVIEHDDLSAPAGLGPSTESAAHAPRTAATGPTSVSPPACAPRARTLEEHDAQTAKPAVATQTVVAKIEAVATKTGTTTRGTWTRFGVKAGEYWYNTFDTKLGAWAENAKAEGIDVKLTFHLKTVNGKPSRELDALEIA